MIIDVTLDLASGRRCPSQSNIDKASTAVNLTEDARKKALIIRSSFEFLILSTDTGSLDASTLLRVFDMHASKDTDYML